MTPTTHTAHRRALRRRATLVLALQLLATVGCERTIDRLLDVTTPSRLGESQFLVPENASLVVASAVADFECAYGSYVVASGLAANELVDASQTASRFSYDRRDVLPGDAHYSTFNCENIGVYTPLSTARHTTDQALRALEGWTDVQVPNRQRLIATAAAYAGYSLLLLGEGFCSAAIDLGPELQSAQLIDSAEARFSRAITAAQAANDQNMLNLALVGRARARLDRGNRAGAAEDAARVPVAFVLNASADNNAARRQNRVFAQNNASTGGVSVAPAYRALTVAGRPDPRVRATDVGRLAADQVTQLWNQGKYAALTTPIPIATGVEAQLILAEARGGQEAVAIVNQLRARTGVALPALTAAEASAIATTIFEERARELWLQGTRWYDLRRGQLSLQPAAGAAYPKAGSYGAQRCWPLPDVERAANPNIGAA
jgi:hypothetical protein